MDSLLHPQLKVEHTCNGCNPTRTGPVPRATAPREEDLWYQYLGSSSSTRTAEPETSDSTDRQPMADGLTKGKLNEFSFSSVEPSRQTSSPLA